ncbi:hypothetical protein FRB93_010023 [Tulasnella sp. JGI-2019a]|nr:hypothetical protein FRB93_010023 [Tulasnella sp. JGI-2019a]
MSFQLRCYESPPGVPWSPAIITLPRLHTFALDLPAWKAGQLLACMDTPLCRRFNFHFIRNASEVFYAGGDKILSSMLKAATKIHLEIFPWKAKFKWRTMKFPLSTQSIDLRLLNLFPRYKLPVVRLVMHHNRTTRPTRQMAPLLSALPSVTSFVLKGARNSDLILDLSTPQTLPSKGWLLPCLRSLKITVAPTDRALLLSMVQARHGDQIKLTDGDGALHSRLKSVAITGYTWKGAGLTYLRENATEVDWSFIM